ncbi:MAG: hypothetical protein LC777_10700 [Actinobacteria bacterium]|nr:hypothetical protein [Actinomycetota bacterium]
MADDRAEHALRDLLDAARRVDEHVCYGAFVLSGAERERLRFLLGDVRRRGERAIDATVRPRLRSLSSRMRRCRREISEQQPVRRRAC